MSGSYREDHLERQIRAVANMLARILGLRVAGRREEARAELERAWQDLEGTHGALLRRLDPASAATLLDSPGRILAAARLTAESAVLEDDGPRAEALRRRAVALGLEARRRSPGHPEIESFLERHTPPRPS